jgi:hypothetical protein
VQSVVVILQSVQSFVGWRHRMSFLAFILDARIHCRFVKNPVRLVKRPSGASLVGKEHV